jgi:hypothetical protein
MTTDINSRIALWRQKAVEGTLTKEDMIEAIKLLSGGRQSAAIASSTSRSKKALAPAPENADDLLDQIGDD